DFLLDRQLEDGGFSEGDAEPARITANALRALLRAECSDGAAVHRAASRLAREFPFPASVAETARAALALYHHRITDGPAEPVSRLRRGPDGSLVGADWTYCVEALEQVSRSFARPIAALPEPLRSAVTCGYLLCRIADTIEDAPDTEAARRDVHYSRLLDVLEGRRHPSHFTRAIGDLVGKPEELELCARIARVLHVLDTVPAPMADAVKRWSSEMVRGMAIYSHRPLGADAIRAPAGIADLERYCYFVAGTVGQMLTELFLLHVEEVSPSAVRTLREEAESFGIGLQLVNILKDITDDQVRGVSYVPRSLAEERGVALPELLDASRRAAAHDVVAPLFDVARAHLDRALEYVLAIPQSEPRVRIFCLLPLWMAARTLVHARGNDAMFVP
ncbi:MAG: squalene/phytoene synthase family protein, partial [Polyangiaceae bacterium]|nr:squalene/phytoene synthase family protein [Polyangiaceae bacterium]